MSFHGAVRMLLVAPTGRQPDAANQGRPLMLPEIPPGRFEAWAREWSGHPATPAAPGSACRTADGCEGILVEVLEQGRTILVCAPA